MAGHLALVYVLSFVFVAIARGQICGTASNEPCDATQIFSTFETSYLAESTSETSQGICSYLVRLSPQIVDGKANCSLLTRPQDGTQVTSVTEIVSITENPAIVTLAFSNDPSTTYTVDVPYADYSACFVTRFNGSIGCRLWVYEGTAADMVEACRAGHVQVCGDPVYNTYDETLCGSGPTASQ